MLANETFLKINTDLSGSIADRRGVHKEASAPRPNGAVARSTQRIQGIYDQNGFHLDSLLDPQHSSLSLNALARSAALSGKRLIIEIRDQHPVRIVRMENSQQGRHAL
jgi:hypothetical protein